MQDPIDLQEMLGRIRVVRPPKLHLATFGTTTFQYWVASDLHGEPSQCRLRHGEVTAKRPAILTADSFRERFAGFGESQERFGQAMERLYGESLRALEYVFRNDVSQTTTEHASVADMLDRIQKDLDATGAPRTALLHAPDAGWSLAVMKFIIEVSLRSFPGNVRELEERGFFDPEGRERARQRQRVEQLFREAPGDPAKRRLLGQTLKEFGLFSDYEDRFFSLF